jgi:hypothetical protein
MCLFSKPVRYKGACISRSSKKVKYSKQQIFQPRIYRRRRLRLSSPEMPSCCDFVTGFDGSGIDYLE